jgi:hypothetical protein
LQCALQTILEAQDNLMPPEIPKEEVEQETVQEEESSPNIFGHFLDSIFQANFETVHPYNTSKTANKPSTQNTTTSPPKQSKLVETKQSNMNPKLDYDVVEDLKKLRANISIYELLKFPFLLQKMLQNISENGKNGNSNGNKVVQSKVPQKTSTKNNPDPQDKGSLPVVPVNNVDKVALETASKNPQATTLNTRKNVPPFLLTFKFSTETCIIVWWT